MKRQRQRLLVLLTCLLAAAAAMPAGAGGEEWRLVEEHWYELFIDGEKAGWVGDALFEKAGRLRTVSESYLKVSRGFEPVELTSRTESIETRSGAPIEVSVTQKISAQPTETRASRTRGTV